MVDRLIVQSTDFKHLQVPAIRRMQANTCRKQVIGPPSRGASLARVSSIGHEEMSLVVICT